VRGVGGVAVIEEAALQERNAKRLEVALRGDSKVSVAEAGFIAKKSLEEFVNSARRAGSLSRSAVALRFIKA